MRLDELRNDFGRKPIWTRNRTGQADELKAPLAPYPAGMTC
jgi:hypothetical protein